MTTQTLVNLFWCPCLKLNYLMQLIQYYKDTIFVIWAITFCNKFILRQATNFFLGTSIAQELIYAQPRLILNLYQKTWLRLFLQNLDQLYSIPPFMLDQGSLIEGERSVRLTSLYKLVYISSFNIENSFYLFYKTSDLNEEVNCTEPSPSLVFLGLTNWCNYSSVTKIHLMSFQSFLFIINSLWGLQQYVPENAALL